MSENHPEGNNPKLRLKSTDTNRFKTETGTLRTESAPRNLSPEGTVPVEQINDPLRARSNTGRLKKVTASDTSEVSAVSPMSSNSKHETVKLRVVKTTASAAPGAVNTPPLRVDGAAGNLRPVSTSAASLKLPHLGGATAAPAAEAGNRSVKLNLKRSEAPAAEASAPKLSIPSLTVKAPTPSAADAEEAKSPAPTLKIRAAGAGVPMGANKSASATLKINPQAVAGGASSAPNANGDHPLKQTGVKLSLKAQDSAATVAVPAPPAEASATAQVPPPAGAHGGLKLKKNDSAAATVAVPAAASSGATAQVAPAGASDHAKPVALDKEPVFIPGAEEPSGTQLSALDGITSLLSFLALGAACYFIVMDFLKYVK